MPITGDSKYVSLNNIMAYLYISIVCNCSIMVIIVGDINPTLAIFQELYRGLHV